jgi:lipoprotein-anchoring transpeptidase ErfK/SrfK
MNWLVLFAATLLLAVTGVHGRDANAAAGGVQIIGGMTDHGSSSANGVYSFDQAALGSGLPQGSARHESKIVPFDRNMEPGSILVRTAERRLYYVLSNGEALMYPIGVGREGYTWQGTNRITRKMPWPDWRPPENMIKREAARGHFLPDFMAGGPENPLGARALYIGSTEFRIHGTTQPWSIGRAVSSGCIRMLNAHVIDLYDRVEVGARVVVE